MEKIINLDFAALVLRNKSLTTTNSLIIFIISLVVISASCKQLVHSSEHLSELLNVNIFFVTFFITAVASSIPDLVLSIKDAKNEKYKDAFSNAYGSNIFDICIGIGLPVLIYLLVNGQNDSLLLPLRFQTKLFFHHPYYCFCFQIITAVYWLKSINFAKNIL